MKNKEKRSLGIYLHIPFCVRKCNYCDFLSAPADLAVRRKYVECLKEEIRQFVCDFEAYEVDSIFFGGGTPSILEGEEIAGIMEVLKERFAWSDKGKAADTSLLEVTIECNPGTLTPEKLETYRKCGINRLSIGLQSARNEELKLLGRIHTWEAFEENYRSARQAGFTNINVDLMSSLPGQTPGSWEDTLKKVLALQPNHISAYSLIIEEGTPFFELYGEEEEARSKGERPEHLPAEEEEREMYYATDRILREAGMQRYEISNYAYPGKESVHNRRYWKRQEYAGFGLGASSQMGRCRYKNTDCLEDYLQGNYERQDVLELTKDEEMEETMYLGLRMMQGVSMEQFREKFGIDIKEIYGEQIEKMQRQGLLCIENGHLKLTSLGIDVSNVVLAEFLL